ncbi:MAG TPA: selenocysteine-specific translation elongation factor [Longimicrobiales bacterium]|nr:selenocysteine-specific translation elongation factor [Longimicrobiales bacterium]
MKQLILGTAGHIDHGKTALVKALTGVDTDRLPEEKKRGITIDLGFANLQIGDISFGIVDVPGHEDLIRNMLAGATGMDAVMLVIAADEGVMPQTREHVAILDLLGVRNAIVALTKSDLATPEWIDLVSDDVRGLLANTTLAGAAIIPVSVISGSGLEDLKAALQSISTLDTSRQKPDADVLRLPIDRVFTVHGTGTVVTGTMWSGRIAVDDQVELQPHGKHVRIRGIQIHGKSASEATAGARVAVALTGVDKAAVNRGDVVVQTGLWHPAQMMTVRIREANEHWSFETRQRVRVHLGTAEVLARLTVLDAEWAQLRLEAPLVARPGDRFVLRSYSPIETIGGGEVASLDEVKRTRVDDETRQVLERCVKRELAAHATLNGVSGVEEAYVKLLDGKTDDVVQIGNRYFSRDVAKGMVARVIETMERVHAEHPLQSTVGRAEVREKVGYAGPGLIDWAIESAVTAGELISVGSGVQRKGFEPVLTAKQVEKKAALAKVIREAGLAPPAVSELDEARDTESLLKLLEAEGAVVSISPEFYAGREAVQTAIRATVARFGGGEAVPASAFRETLAVSRKHLIPLLEYLDRVGVTTRKGDLRTVRAPSEDD